MLAASLVALALSAAASAGPALKLTISGDKKFIGASKAVVTATLTNVGDATAELINDPNTVLSKSETNTFAIASTSGAAPKFVGKFVKFAPQAASTTVLAPGASITVEHNLGSAYDFRNTGAGNYTIQTSSLFTLKTESGLESISADTSAHQASLTGELYQPALRKRATYSSCTSSEKTQLATAAVNGQSYANAAYSYLQSHSTAGTTRFTTWFGTWTSSHYSTVLSHYQHQSSGNFSAYAFDCSCTDADTYAYTYAADTGDVYLCGYYWNAPATGTDSQAGTLVHESSHWTAYGGTQDYVYGQTSAKSLAISNSAHAILNADNHEYFAENNPALS